MRLLNCTISLSACFLNFVGVIGFFEATKFLQELVDKKEICRDDIFKVHEITMVNPIMDIYKPVGAWKKETNGTYHQNKTETVWVEYPHPKFIPAMMDKWLELLNKISTPMDIKETIAAYTVLHISFVSIHPFYDGNGRVARLLANIPVLRSGMPPITINSERRKEYIKLMSGFSIEKDLHLQGDIKLFEKFADENYKEVFKLTEQAYTQQNKRNLSADQDQSF
jgi:Fic family protein